MTNRMDANKGKKCVVFCPNCLALKNVVLDSTFFRARQYETFRTFLAINRKK